MNDERERLEAAPVSQGARTAAVNWCLVHPFHAEADIISAGEWDHHSLVQAFARFEAALRAETAGEIARLREALRLFPEAYDVLTRAEMRAAKGNWRSLIDQQSNALNSIRTALAHSTTEGEG